MILLVAGLALIAIGLIVKYDRTMPTWLRTTIMAATVVALGAGIAIAATALG